MVLPAQAVDGLSIEPPTTFGKQRGSAPCYPLTGCAHCPQSQRALIKEGALDAYRQMQHEAVRALEADKPRTLAMLPHLDADGTRLTIVHLFADAESMDLHFVGAAERSAAAYEVLVPDGWEIYGTPSDQTLDTMRSAAVASGSP